MNASFHTTSLILLALLMLATFGCEKNQARQDSRPGENTEAATASPPTETAAPAASKKPEAPPKAPSLADQMKAAKGQVCLNDSGCPGYLRCLEKTCATPLAMTGEHDESTPVVTFSTPDGKEHVRYYVELATNNPERMRGLMYRQSMKPDWGMLFVYPPGDRPLSFWMKNTYIPLDMIFIDTAGEVVGIVEGAEPLTLTSRTTGHPSRFVLELLAGTAKKQGVVPGMRMDLLNAPRDDFKPLR